MSQDDGRVWSERYRAGNTGWDLGKPAPNLQRLAREWIKPGSRVVVPGCGRGHDVCALAAAGYEVSAIDIAPEAIRFGAEQSRKRSLEVEWVAGDMLADRPLWAERFDAWVELTCYCAIDPAQRGAYVRQALRWLRPGGLVVGVFFVGLPVGGPPYDTSPEELEESFAGFERLHLAVSNDSVPERSGLEWEGIFRKPGRIRT